MISLRPDASRARAIDQRMRERLADSLVYIFDQAEGRIDLPAPAERSAFLDRLKAGPAPPLAFGAYCDAVLALGAGQNDVAESLIRQIVAMPSAQELRIDSLGDVETDEAAQRIERLVDTDPEQSIRLKAPDPAHAEACEALVRDALALMRKGDPDLAAELDALVRQIVLVDTVELDKGPDLSGASSFMLWGAVLLNARIQTDLVDLVGSLAHESGHNVLFGLCADGPLVLNEDLERFASPLRADPRPMDGIVHAVYVVARMHQALSAMLRSGVLTEAQACRARECLVEEEAAYRRGRETVRQQARLTPLGEEVMAGVDAYMADVMAPAD